MNVIPNKDNNQHKHIFANRIKVFFLNLEVVLNIQKHDIVIWLSFLILHKINYEELSNSTGQLHTEEQTSSEIMLKFYILPKTKADLPSAPCYKL